ncbi:MAG: ABC transporter ATP-binding protein [Clostridiales bacterium]|nr:ABC transporter ATP-binding protein [Clostridiales bacterium]
MQTHKLSKKYGELLVLDGVSLTLRQGDVYGLVGRNGAGKTTFFKCVMGLARPTAGTIEIGGEKNSLHAARRKIGFMISPSFFPYLNPKENLEYLCRLKGIRTRGEVGRLLDLVGLGSVKKPFKAFSLGMKQRLGLAGALLGSPEIVVLDEPVNGLDPQGIIDMRAIIKNANTQTGTTFIVSSHILSELDLVATQFGFIEQGVLLEEISHADLHENTKETLAVEVNDTQKAQGVLRQIGIECRASGSGRLTLQSHLDRPNEIARSLINSGLELYGLHRQEITLEEYFLRLIGGRNAQHDQR